MSSIENREYYIEDPELPKLFLQSWGSTSKTPQGVILITHGISEHSECYEHVGKALAEAGWFVYGWDLQGHGKSQGKRGYIKDFKHFARDLNSVVKKIKQDETKPTENFHLLGHSMGGLITLHALLLENPPEVKSVVLSSPCLGIALEVPKIKEMASHWLNQFWPTLTLENDVQHHNLSRDPEMVASYGKDPLRHAKVSAPLYLGMVEAMEYVNTNSGHLNVPLFMQVAGQDKIVDPQASLNFYKNVEGQKVLKLYEESFHEVYNDLNKEEGISDLIAQLGEYI